MSLLRKPSNSSRATSPIGSKANSPSGRRLSTKLRFATPKTSNHSGTTFIKIQSAPISPPPRRSPILRQADNNWSIQYPNTSQPSPGLKAPSSASPVQEPEGSCSLRDGPSIFELLTFANHKAASNGGPCCFVCVRIFIAQKKPALRVCSHRESLSLPEIKHSGRKNSVDK